MNKRVSSAVAFAGYLLIAQSGVAVGQTSQSETSRTIPTFAEMISEKAAHVGMMNAAQPNAPAMSSSGNGPSYTESALYTFTGGTDGAFPYLGGLSRDWLGNLYGTTPSGGDLNCSAGTGYGCGVVFKLDPHGKETVLYFFTGGADGGNASGFNTTPILDNAGNVYGTTGSGGSSGAGVVFQLQPDGKETVLYNFPAGTGGYAPMLLRDYQGSLYGTTFAGGNGCGLVYKLQHPVFGWSNPPMSESVLYAFPVESGQPCFPDSIGPLFRDEQGNLYGETTESGTSFGGTIYRLDPFGRLTVLFTFNVANGETPNGGLVRDDQGSFYGTTYLGGLYGAGTVFKLDSKGNHTILYNFTGGTDGFGPSAGVVRDEQGNLYGTTLFGGNQGASCGGYCGLVFEVSPAGQFTVLYAFLDGADGANPSGQLVMDDEGNLYGTAAGGGDFTGSACLNFGCGVVFKLTRQR